MPNSNSIIVSDGIPNNRHGSNGDITIRYIKGSGVYLFIKAKNKISRSTRCYIKRLGN